MENLFLIRHAVSKQNEGLNIEEKLPDHAVELSETGIKMARETGIWLNQYLIENNIDLSHARLYVSPFTRTRQTAQLINESLKIEDIVEDYLLIEHQYGLFSDNLWPDNKIMFPTEYEYYDRFYKHGGKFYQRFPMGESPMDVAIRTRMFLNELKNEDIDNVFIVSHGTALKTLIMNYFRYSPDWYAHSGLIKNCEVRHLDKDNNMKILKR